jgi:hypothetical protein
MMKQAKVIKECHLSKQHASILLLRASEAVVSINGIENISYNNKAV